MARLFVDVMHIDFLTGFVVVDAKGSLLSMNSGMIAKDLANVQRVTVIT